MFGIIDVLGDLGVIYYISVTVCFLYKYVITVSRFVRCSGFIRYLMFVLFWLFFVVLPEECLL